MKSSTSRAAGVCILLAWAAPAVAHMPAAAPAESLRQVASTGATPAFDRTYVDLDYGGNTKPGWVRAGDMDLDCDLDLVAGGGYALFIYENDGSASGWKRYGNLDGSAQIGANGGELWDVDGDGDLDVVSARYNSELRWWENPGGSLSNATWSHHSISSESRYLHDLIRVDIDRDGVAEEFIANLNQGYYNANITIKWYRPGADPEQPWEQHTIEANRTEGAPHGHAGLDLADIDGDGDLDLAYSNGWYKGSGDPSRSWTWHEVTTQYGISNTLARDMDEDGDLDLVMGAGHHGKGVYWYQQPADPIAGIWTQHAIDATLWHPECLQSVDLGADGDVDIVTCDLFFGEAPGEPGWNEQVHNIYLFENLPAANSWHKTNIAPDSYPSHQLQVTDVNQDGQWDIISESAGYRVISYYENTAEGITYDLVVVDDTYPGNGRPGWSASGDIDGDGDVDVVAGGGGAIHWYRASDWTRFPLESPSTAGGNGGLILDVDGDGDLDVIAALYNEDLVWWQNPGPASVEGHWVRHSIDSSISRFNHDLVFGDIDDDSQMEIVALYVGGGIYWYDIPQNPAAGAWPRTRILSNITDPYVGLAVCDLDGDLDNDVVASNFWYERPANPAAPDWDARQLFDSPVQNVSCYDVNRDGRVDVVGAEGFVYPDGDIRWVEAPPAPGSDLWTERLIIGQLDGPENLWVGDLDGDGLTDIVSGEMGTSSGFNDSDGNLFVMQGRSPEGTLWERRQLACKVGISARIQDTDVDQDGGIDFTADGNAEDHIYLWHQVGGTSIFANGFEVGDVSAWSHTTR